MGYLCKWCVCSGTYNVLAHGLPNCLQLAWLTPLTTLNVQMQLHLQRVNYCGTRLDLHVQL